MSIQLLFLGGDDDCRPTMAAAFADAHSDGQVAIAWAALSTNQPDPLADEVMRDVPAFEEADSRYRGIDELFPLVFDVIVCMSSTVEQACPLLPGRPAVICWDLPDPGSFSANPARRRQAYCALRDRIAGLTTDFFRQGYLEAFVAQRKADEMIIDSISDGILAHDLDRRIVCFNRAAERITGLKRREVLGRDCHTVFDGNFCGGKCAFTNASEPHLAEVRRTVEIANAAGEPRLLETRLQPLFAGRAVPVGVVLSFQDKTREQELARRMGDVQTFAGIIGRDAKMQTIYELVRDVAPANVPVLIEGESGTGKELVAAAIHNESPRAGRLFVPVNCGALPEGVLESELFGHVKGAFTGAVRDKKGRFELADGGTIFLDEIGDIPPAMQVRLLRVLQEGTFERVGGEQTIHVDVRVISATHRNLRNEIESGRFREDLFYRLNVMPIRLPPLRERRNDVPLLAEHFLNSFSRDMDREGVRIGPEAMSVLTEYDWPGNVRELQNWIQYALVKCRKQLIKPEHWPPQPGTPFKPAAGYARSKPRGRRGLSEELVRDALEKCGGKRVEAARWLGVSRATLYRYFKDHAGFSTPDSIA